VQPLELLGERDFIEVNGDFRIFLSAQLHEGGKPSRCNTVGQRDTQLTVIARCCGPHAGASLIQCGEHTWHMFEQQLASARQSGAARGAREQRRPQVFLQLLDRARQRGLVDMQPFGGTRKVEFFGHGKEAP
jgi:hypothetical protein